jgi:diguanylate cyclase (GGDEF)-like protein
MPVTEHGSPYVDEPHPDGSCAQGAGRSGPEPMDPVARVDLQRAQQARYGTEPHPDAALFASRLTRVVADSPAGSTPAGLPSGAGAPPPPGPAADGVAAAGVPASVGTPRASATAPPTGPAALTALPGERDESTVKLTPAGPTRPRPRPSPRPRALGLVTGAGEPPLGIVEGPASATTKAPAAVARALGRAALVGDLFEPAGFDPAGAPLRERVELPLPAAAAALVRDRADRIVQVNPALRALTGRTEADLLGTALAALVVGTGTEALVVGYDAPVPVHLLQWDVPDRELQVVVLVPRPDHGGERRFTAELERMARVGTWRYELATGTLHRSEPLQEIYGERGVEPDGSSGPVEGEQVALLVRSLRAGAGLRDHEAELVLPGARLSCRAEVEFGPDGAPARLIGVVRDVTGQHELEARARHAARRFADLAALVPTGVAIVDPDGVVREVNPALCALLDVVPEQLRGVPVAALCADPVSDPGATALDGPLHPPLPGWLRPVAPGAARRYQVEAVPLLRGDRTTVWCELAVSTTTLDDDGWFWLLACTDVSEQRRAAELLRSAGTVDELTRLPNRGACLELLHDLLARPDRDRVAVICGDLDDFRRVNSALGHEAGDDLLVTLAGRLQRELPVGCTAARLGADEFVVVSGDSADAGGPEALASTVAGLLRTTLTVRGRPVQLTASVGVAVPPEGGDVAAADLLRFAEVAMHDAKRSSRGGVALATDGVVGSATRDLELEAELRAAIVANTLVLEYQPVVGPDGLVCTAEALVRWPHPEHGVIPPCKFLPIAQRGGLLRELDDWVLRTACREAAGWPEHGGRPVAVAVNLAGLLPGDPEFRATVTDIVESAGLPWDRLVLEVVETSLVALPAHALAAMERLVQRGVRFAIDDFGTGYSSLARLKELPAQIVKVDRAFVRGVATDPADFAVARAVVDMAKAMGRSTVAEGVETTEQYHVLRGVGVDAQQGWLFARSLPPQQLRELLAGGRVAVPAGRGD